MQKLCQGYTSTPFCTSLKSVQKLLRKINNLLFTSRYVLLFFIFAFIFRHKTLKNVIASYFSYKMNIIYDVSNTFLSNNTFDITFKFKLVTLNNNIIFAQRFMSNYVFIHSFVIVFVICGWPKNKSLWTLFSFFSVHPFMGSI